jgi:hypothetical protein
LFGDELLTSPPAPLRFGEGSQARVFKSLSDSERD